MRKRGRVDSNQSAVVDELREGGATVEKTSSIGNGFVDLTVGYKGFNFLFEVKDGKKYPSQRKLTDDEKKFFETWRGQRDIIESSTQAFVIMDKFIEKYVRT